MPIYLSFLNKYYSHIMKESGDKPWRSTITHWKIRLHTLKIFSVITISKPERPFRGGIIGEYFTAVDAFLNLNLEQKIADIKKSGTCKIIDFSEKDMVFKTQEVNCGKCPSNCEIICVYRNGVLIDSWRNRCDKGALKKESLFSNIHISFGLSVKKLLWRLPPSFLLQR